LIPELRHLEYEDKLKALNLTTLEVRRLRGDLILIFKIFKGFVKVELNGLLAIHSFNSVGTASVTRGHKMRIRSVKVNNCLSRISFPIELHL
jgi:hypothetical protein